MRERVKKHTIRNPLMKRLPRELKTEIGKYIVIFAFFAGVIALVSGFLVADDSLILAYNQGFEKYKVEDGNFELSKESSEQLKNQIEDENITLYENYYVEENVSENGSVLRIFANRTQVDLVCLMDGAMPDTDDEIAIDRMYADNNDLKIGDSITVGGKRMIISGLVALSDYSALFSDNSQMMFDAVKFGVAITTERGFASFGDTHLHYNYSWTYDEKPANENEEKTQSDEFMKTIAKVAALSGNSLENYIPGYLNQAIHFTGDDMGSDKGMIMMFLYIVVLIIAFVFAITTSNTLTKEAAVIGTLRASGYKRSELVRHYLTMPMIVVTLSAIVGNILGYTVMKGVMASLYYGSYSLPTYVTQWNMDAFLLTTLIPMAIMFLINFIILAKKLRLSPLKFLRRDLSKRKNRRALKLPGKMKLFGKFRTRIILQNMPNYLTLFVGILFANFIMMFGLFLKPMLNHFADEITTNMISEYQYVLKSPVSTNESDAEAFCAKTLETLPDYYKSEEITVYGIKTDSRYLTMELSDDEVIISEGYAEKYGIKAGDSITLKESYEDTEYTFYVKGTYDYPSTLTVFMSQKQFNSVFDHGTDYYNGYFSNTKITDIDDKLIAATITQDDLTKVSRQLKVSMGDMMNILVGFGVLMSMLLVYLLSKLIIERNAQSISMVKILGYTNREINGLYILSTTLVFILSLVISLPICSMIMEKLMVIILADYAGWLPYYVGKSVFPTMLGLCMACYIVVLIFQMNKIKKIPKADALKNVE